MKKIIMILTLCGFMMFPHISYAYDGEMSGTGATEVSYSIRASDYSTCRNSDCSKDRRQS